MLPVPRTKLAALPALAVAALAIAGCGSSSSSTSSTTSAAAGTTASAPTADTAFVTPLSGSAQVASTVPANGDINPYGIAFVPTSVGKLKAGQMLVSNFNAEESAQQNGQGTGKTIVQVSPTGTSTLFAQIDANTLPGPCPGGVGLTTALNILPGGYVVVGSLPTTNGKTATAQYGCLIVLNSEGKPVKTIATNNIQGPWDSTAKSEGSKTTLFVSNALNGGAAKGVKTIDNSTVLRIELESGANQAPKVTGEQVIAEGIPWVNSAEALVLGPTGLALASNGTLYVASTQNNEILAIPEAATRTTAAAKGGSVLTAGGHLKEPLGMALAPNGDLITTNGGDGNMVETTRAGKQIAVRTADTKTGAGALFGLAISPDGNSIYYVDDGENTVRVLHDPPPAVKIDSASNAVLGQSVLTSSSGRTLYALSPETAHQLLCKSHECLELWPPLTVPSSTTKVELGAGVHGHISILHRSGGTFQVVLNGQPLYRFADDHAKDEVNGQNLKSFGGTWHALSTSGHAITKAPSSPSSSSGTSTQSQGSSGYEY
jgi:predicted lipoprotein with Yx(FWY)xxD motif